MDTIPALRDAIEAVVNAEKRLTAHVHLDRDTTRAEGAVTNARGELAGRLGALERLLDEVRDLAGTVGGDQAIRKLLGPPSPPAGVMVAASSRVAASLAEEINRVHRGVHADAVGSTVTIRSMGQDVSVHVTGDGGFGVSDYLPRRPTTPEPPPRPMTGADLFAMARKAGIL